MSESMNYKALGEKIRRIRLSMGVTQDVLATQMHMCPSYLGHLERGSRKASLDTLITLCNHLKVSPEYLLAESLDSDAFPSARKLSVRQATALKEIYAVIEATILDWNRKEEELEENEPEGPEAQAEPENELEADQEIEPEA